MNLKWVGQAHLTTHMLSEVTTTEKIQKIHKIAFADCRIKVSEIEETIGMSTERVHNSLHENLCMTKLCARWVLHLSLIHI